MFDFVCVYQTTALIRRGHENLHESGDRLDMTMAERPVNEGVGVRRGAEKMRLN